MLSMTLSRSVGLLRDLNPVRRSPVPEVTHIWKDQKGRVAFGIKVRPKTKEFALLKSEAWCTPDMVTEVQAMLSDLKALASEDSINNITRS